MVSSRVAKSVARMAEKLAVQKDDTWVAERAATMAEKMEASQVALMAA